MQLLKGTEILLYGNGTPETIGNILIGEASADGKSYTLGIPKGDQHSWTDRKLVFFGRAFRTIGFPAQGIEANIPLSWGQNVHVVYAEITGKCTVYEKNTFARHVFNDVFFFDGRGEKTTRTGSVPTDSVKINIYSFAHDGSYIPKIGDLVVNGECEVVFDTASEQSVSASMTALRSCVAGDVITISNVAVKQNGLLPDIEIAGR